MFLKTIKQFNLLALFLAISFIGHGQTDTLPPPFKRFPTVPPVKLLLTDSTTWFTKEDVSKKLPVLIILFSPQCEHCKLETEAILKNIDLFKNIQIIMSTTMSFDSMKVFYDRYELSRFENIVVGQDRNFLLPTFYAIHYLPFLAFYNKKKELMWVVEGGLGPERMLERFKE